MPTKSPGGLSLSADGRYLVGALAASGAPVADRLVRLDLVTEARPTASGTTRVHSGGAVSADGSTMVATTLDPGGRPRLTLFRPDSPTGPIQVPIDGFDVGEPVMSADGGTVVVRFTRSVHLGTTSPPRSTLVVSRSGATRWLFEGPPAADAGLARTAGGVLVVDRGAPDGPSGWAIRRSTRL